MGVFDKGLFHMLQSLSESSRFTVYSRQIVEGHLLLLAAPCRFKERIIGQILFSLI